MGLRIDSEFRQVFTSPDPSAFTKPKLVDAILRMGPRYTELYGAYRRNIAYVSALRSRLIWERFRNLIYVINYASSLRRCQCGALYGRCTHTEDA